MMKVIKRWTALLLVMIMVLSTGYHDVTAGALQPVLEENTETETETETNSLVNFLVIEEPMVSTPGIQRIMLSIGDGTQKIENVGLMYENMKSGQQFEVFATEILDDFILFEISFGEDCESGSYRLENISYSADGDSISTDFAEMGIDAAFGVNTVVESTPDDILLTDEELEALAAETNMNVVSLNGEEEASKELIQDALENAGCEVETTSFESLRKGAKTSGNGGLIVVLDPGHGGTDGGAQANGVLEKTANLKIAQYCKAELEEYAGVVVYMTREDDNTYLTLAQRAQVALDKKADLFVSLHNNSNESSAPSGANVYYPNANYNAECGSIGKSIASIVESKLTDLGLASGGIHIRNSEDGTKYSDGSTADYYGVIKRCKENDIPAILIEHAFVSNAGDAKNFLSTDEQLKKLGIADATGIAEYYGLSKGIGFTRILAKNSTTIELQWKKQEGVSGYCIYKSNTSSGDFTRVATISSASTTNWQDINLAPGQTYYYKIRSYTTTKSGTKYSAYSPVAAGMTIERPEIVSLKTKNSKAMVISWDAVTNAAGYEIYRSTSESGSYTSIGTVSGTTSLTYTDTTVKAGKLYYYKIRAWIQDGSTTIYSDYSQTVYGRTAKIPSKLAVKSQNSNTLRVSWKAEKNVTGYVIQRAVSKNGKYKKIATISDAQADYYDDTTVKTGTTYYYRIQSFNHNYELKGYSGYSKAVSGKTLKKTSITQMVSNSSNEMTIKWKKADGVDGYVIYRSTKKNGTYTKVKTIKSANTTSYTDKKLTPGTKYYYKVRTRKKINGTVHYGSDSKVRTAWAGKKAVITEVSGTTGTKIRITWDEVAGAQSYDIYRSTSKKGKYKKIASVPVENGTSYEDKKLKMTQKYYYKVEAKVKGYKAVGTSGKSSAAGGYPMNVGTITSVAVNANNQLQINWKKVNNVTGYRLYRSKQADGSYTLLATISENKDVSYVDISAETGVTYYYKLVLINTYAGSTVYGKYSAAVSGVILGAPKDVAVVSVAENQLNITWSSVAGAVGYTIYRSTEYAGTYTAIGVTEAGSLTGFEDTTVTKDVTYYYKITATGPNNSSSAFSGTVAGCAVAKPVINSVAWNADATGFQIICSRPRLPFQAMRCTEAPIPHQQYTQR